MGNLRNHRASSGIGVAIRRTLKAQGHYVIRHFQKGLLLKTLRTSASPRIWR